MEMSLWKKNEGEEQINKVYIDRIVHDDIKEVNFVDTREKFFKEFLYITRNPYLKNNILCWKKFLENTMWEYLFYDTKFCNDFAQTICNITKWDKNVIDLFEQYIEKSGDFEIIGDMEKYKKIKFFKDFYVSKEQKEMHKFILDKLHKYSIDLKLDNNLSMEYYMKFYLQYAAMNDKQIEEIYHKSRRQVILIESLFFLLIVIIIVSLLIIKKL